MAEEQSALLTKQWNTKTDGEMTEKNIKQKLTREGYSQIKHYTFRPIWKFPNRVLKVDMVMLVIRGQFEVRIPGGKVVLGEGEMVFVPKDTVHDARVVGSEHAVCFEGLAG